MTPSTQRAALAALLAAAFAGDAFAANIEVTADIAGPGTTVWTANNRYDLTQQIYVLPGATLVIEAGTVVASTPTANGSGSLAVARGGQIFVNGTASAPVIMTSTNDTDTWLGGNPETGTWREAANEWGNLTLMGNAFISEDATAGNTAAPSATNTATMEGLSSGPATDTYGGGDDDDDTGSISYLSIRYGGRVLGLGNELNGMSCGGLGRETDISFVEIMNNVDDGIEVWGGTVNFKNFSIWNIGDDSFDVDQGWRGKAQFGLIVQGHSLDASQGSGVGDNMCEIDGAEDSDYQPVTTCSLWNMTLIGQPADGDGATTWRDNARVQYHSSIIMDCGENVVRFDNDDGDGASGYGHNGTLSWADTWTTPYTATSAVNAFTNRAAAYTAQTSGMLASITGSVFFRNLASSAYDEANARGVFNSSNGNSLVPGFSNNDGPVAKVVRGPLVVRGGKNIFPVVTLDPTPRNEALVPFEVAPNDGFFSSARYIGAFSPNADDNWLCGWSASDHFDFLACDPPANPGYGLGRAAGLSTGL